MLYETILRYLVDAQIFVDRKRHKLGIALSVFSAESQPASTWANTNMFCAGKFLMPSQKIYARQKLSKLISNKKKRERKPDCKHIFLSEINSKPFFFSNRKQKAKFFFVFSARHKFFMRNSFWGFFSVVLEATAETRTEPFERNL